MNTDRYSTPGGPPPPDLDDAVSRAAAGQARREGVKRIRRASNWTAAILLVGTGATTIGLASQALPASASTTASNYATPGTSGQVANSPHVSGPVTTSGGSGAVVTTTRVGNNGQVVTPARSASAGGNN